MLEHVVVRRMGGDDKDKLKQNELDAILKHGAEELFAEEDEEDEEKAKDARGEDGQGKGDSKGGGEGGGGIGGDGGGGGGGRGEEHFCGCCAVS